MHTWQRELSLRRCGRREKSEAIEKEAPAPVRVEVAHGEKHTGTGTSPVSE